MQKPYKFLRPYQLRAIQALQDSAAKGNDRYLFEMATGTGKTLVSAAIIKLFLKSGNAKRILFLVDRLELEDQAAKNFRSGFQRTTRQLSIKKTKTIGAKQRLLFRRFRVWLSTTSTKNFFHLLILTFLFPMKPIAP